MIQRLLVILFSLFLFAPAMITHYCHYIQKKQVKRQIKRRIISGIDKSELVLLKFHVRDTNTLLRWEHAREFEFEEQMYDVVDRETISDTVSYWCWWDYEETKLNKQLASIVIKLLAQNEARQQNTDLLIHFFKTLYCISPDITLLNIPHAGGNLKFKYTLLSSSVNKSPPYPPPDFFPC